MSTARHISRRRSPRLSSMGLITAELLNGRRLSLIDISSDGFAVDSPEPFKVGTRHHFTFRTPVADHLVASAQVVASLPKDGTKGFTAHFKFSAGDHASRESVEQLLDTLTSQLKFL